MDRFTEIASYLDSNDFDLSRRRILDLAYDSRNNDLLIRAVQWSRSLRMSKDKVPFEIVDEGKKILSEAQELLLKESDNQDKGLLLKANNISKKYKKGFFQLHPISIELGYGEILGIVGENGHGKTTMLRCLGGDLLMNQGTVEYYFLKGKPIDYYIVKQHISFIPQRIPRWYGRLKDNLHFSALLCGLTDKDNDLSVDFMLERLGLSEYADLTWDQISSGYRTKFEIARILIQRPKLLILDEPLANLDINAQQILLNDLRFMAKSSRHPMGIMLSSQQLHEVEKIADNVIFIKKGQYIFSTKESEAKSDIYTIELEADITKSRLEELLTLVDSKSVVRFNGGNFTIESSILSPENMLNELLKAGVKITYYRNITNSTKKYFNQ